MASYGPSGTFDSSSWTPPDNELFDPNSSSYENELLDVFNAQPYQSYPQVNHHLSNNQDVFGMSGQRIASGSSRAGGYSEDDGNSPQDSSNGHLSYASSTGYSTGQTSGGIDFDLDSMFQSGGGGGSTSNGDSPPFDFGNSMMCDFNATNLQGLFSTSSSQPIPQFQQQIPFQNLSPSSTNATSPPYSISSIAPSSSSPSDYNYLANQTQPLTYPSQYLAPNSAAATYPTPSRHPSISSGASPNYGQPVFVQEEDTTQAKRRRLTLAETAGLAPQSHPSLSSTSSNTFTVKPDAFGQIQASQPLLAPAPPPTAKTQRQKSPVELIANAGMGRGGVYHPREFGLCNTSSFRY